MSLTQNELNFIKSTLLPQELAVAPPAFHSQATFVKQLSVTGVFQVASTNGLLNEQVPTNTGLLVWQPQRDCFSMWRMGIVPAGATINTNDPRLTATYNWSTCQFAPVVAASVFTWNYPVPLPYSSILIGLVSDQLKISPDISSSFSQVRVIGGMMQLTTDTDSIGDINLNGVLSAGITNDSRTVSQSNVSPTGITCFDSLEIAQKSTNLKDGYYEEAVDRGMVSVVGSDIQQNYAAPNADLVDGTCGNWQTFPLTGGVPTHANGGHGGNMGGELNTFYSGWISPWGTSFLDANSGQVDLGAPQQNPVCQNINFGPINLAGVLDIKFTANVERANGANGQADYQVTFTHLFCTCSSDGSVNYQFFKEYPPATVCQTRDLEPITMTYTSDPRNYLSAGGYGAASTNSAGLSQIPPGFTNVGMYIGTQIFLTYRMGDPTAAALNLQGGIYGGNISARARNLYCQGELGSTRIMRWDSLSNSLNVPMVLRVNGVINVQCVPEGTVAPFVQEQIAKDAKSSNLQMMTVISELYNGDGRSFRKIWTMPEYKEAAQNAMNLHVDMLHENVQYAAESAGLFENEAPTSTKKKMKVGAYLSKDPQTGAPMVVSVVPRQPQFQVARSWESKVKSNAVEVPATIKNPLTKHFDPSNPQMEDMQTENYHASLDMRPLETQMAFKRMRDGDGGNNYHMEAGPGAFENNNNAEPMTLWQKINKLRPSGRTMAKIAAGLGAAAALHHHMKSGGGLTEEQLERVVVPPAGVTSHPWQEVWAENVSDVPVMGEMNRKPMTVYPRTERTSPREIAQKQYNIRVKSYNENPKSFWMFKRFTEQPFENFYDEETGIFKADSIFSKAKNFLGRHKGKIAAGLATAAALGAGAALAPKAMQQYQNVRGVIDKAQGYVDTAQGYGRTASNVASKIGSVAAVPYQILSGANVEPVFYDALDNPDPDYIRAMQDDPGRNLPMKPRIEDVDDFPPRASGKFEHDNDLKRRWIQGAVNPEHKGDFTRKANKYKMTPTDFAEYVLDNRKRFDPHTVKEAGFVHSMHSIHKEEKKQKEGKWRDRLKRAAKYAVLGTAAAYGAHQAYKRHKIHSESQSHHGVSPYEMEMGYRGGPVEPYYEEEMMGSASGGKWNDRFRHARKYLDEHPVRRRRQ